MKNRLIILPVLLVSMAVGFVVYRSPGFAEDISMADGAQSVYQGPAEDISIRTGGAQSSVPADIYYTESVKSVIFSHKVHAVDAGYKCTTCHDGIFQMKAKNVEGKPDFNMKGLADGKYCGMCHSSKNKAAFSSDTQCARCHVGVKGLEQEQ